jgi:hypothetical protein
MIVCEYFVYVRNVEVVTLGDGFRPKTQIFDALVNVPDGDSASFDMRFVVDRRIRHRDDPVPLLRHLDCCYGCNVFERSGSSLFVGQFRFVRIE